MAGSESSFGKYFHPIHPNSKHDISKEGSSTSVENDSTNLFDIHLTEDPQPFTDESNYGAVDSGEIFEDSDIGLQSTTREPLTVEEARNELIDYRERVISKSHPLSPLSRGILRKTMLELLLNLRPTTREQFRTRIPEIYKEQTEEVQIGRHLDYIIGVLKQLDAR